MRPPGLGRSSCPPLGLALLTGCFRSPLSLSDLDLTSHHLRGPPPDTPVLGGRLSLGTPGYFCA